MNGKACLEADLWYGEQILVSVVFASEAVGANSGLCDCQTSTSGALTDERATGYWTTDVATCS